MQDSEETKESVQDRYNAVLLQYLTPDPEDKITIRFRAVGRAPILKQQVYRIASMQRFHRVSQFLLHQLSMPANADIYIYVNMSFIPAQDEILHNLYSCFKSDNQLLLSYSLTPAFG